MDSDLNPEAPEFRPILSTVSQGGYGTLSRSIRTSNTFPSGSSHELFKTYNDFNMLTSQIGNNVVDQANGIVRLELPNLRFKKNDLEYNSEILIECNDSILDRTYMNMDQLKGEKKGNSQNQTANIASWNNKPVIAKVEVGSAMLIGAKNIPRPQLSFKDPIDNSENLWVPKIFDKPNNFKPLALVMLYNDEGEAVGYEHPYQVELNLYHPPPWVLAPSAQPVFPKPLHKTKFTFVATEQQVDGLVNHLLEVDELAVDVEHHSYRTYQGITCLIQITTDKGGDFIVDAIAAREHIYKLNVIFTDPQKVKVLHGADMDVLWLQRDFGVYIVGLFDTHQAARELQINTLSLKSLLHKYCNVDADKKYQLADWRMRPLPQELINYARLDTHYLLYIWRMMRADLLAAGDGQPHLLLSVFEKSRQICGQTYNKEVVHEDSHMKLYLRSKKSFDSRQMAALKMLYKWRDAQAREIDESTTYLLPNHMMLSLAETLPREVQGVNACCSPMPPFVKLNLITIHKMILSCRELPIQPQILEIPQSINEVVNATQNTTEAQTPHDYSQHPTHTFFRDEQRIVQNKATNGSEDLSQIVPDVKVMVLIELSQKQESDLNSEALLDMPPFDRYKSYRVLAQMEEIKEFEAKEAKIAAIAKGNEIIQSEVLSKLQSITSKIKEDAKIESGESAAEKVATEKPPTEGAPTKEPTAEQPAGDNTEAATVNSKQIKQPNKTRKRKISNEKAENNIEPTIKESREQGQRNNPSYRKNIYINSKYRNFFDPNDNEPHNKQGFIKKRK